MDATELSGEAGLSARVIDEEHALLVLDRGSVKKLYEERSA